MELLVFSMSSPECLFVSIDGFLELLSFLFSDRFPFLLFLHFKFHLVEVVTHSSDVLNIGSVVLFPLGNPVTLVAIPFLVPVRTHLFVVIMESLVKSLASSVVSSVQLSSLSMIFLMSLVPFLLPGSTMGIVLVLSISVHHVPFPGPLVVSGSVHFVVLFILVEVHIMVLVVVDSSSLAILGVGIESSLQVLKVPIVVFLVTLEKIFDVVDNIPSLQSPFLGSQNSMVLSPVPLPNSSDIVSSNSPLPKVSVSSFSSILKSGVSRIQILLGSQVLSLNSLSHLNSPLATGGSSVDASPLGTVVSSSLGSNPSLAELSLGSESVSGTHVLDVLVDDLS